MVKYYKIAGLTVKMDSFGRTAEQAEPYCCDPCDAPEIIIESDWPLKKQFYPDWTDDLGEYIATGWDFYKKLLHFDGLMLHSSAVVVDGKAYLFTADSGTGKSTHTGLWLKKFPGAYILNDDKPALRLEQDGWYAYGTPWSGKNDISAAERVPVAGIAVLERAEKNTIEPFGGIGAVREILKQVNRPRDTRYREMLLELMDKLITQVPVWKLHCNMDPEAAEVSYGAMSGGK